MNKKTKRTLTPKLRFLEFRDKPGWEERCLANACRVTQGGTPDTSNAEYWNGTTNWITPAEMGKSDSPFVNSTARKITKSGLKNCSSELLPVRSVIMSTRAPIGHLAINTQPMAINQGCRGLIPNKDMNYAFLYSSLVHAKPRLVDLGAGNTFKELSGTALKSFAIPIPSPAEQQKIADCLSSLDELIAAEGRKLEALRAHKKGLMQQLFPRPGETRPRLRFPEFHNAPEWEVEKVGDLFHLQDGFAFKSTDFIKSKEKTIQVVRISDINNKNTNEDKVYISEAFFNSTNLGKYTINDGDMLLSLTGAAGFNFFLWDGGRAVINQRTSKITHKKKRDCALTRLLEPLIHDKINARGEGQNNNLSKEFLSGIDLYKPRPEEQKRLAECFSSIDDLITAQARRIEAFKTHKKGLMQQLFPSPEEAEA